MHKRVKPPRSQSYQAYFFRPHEQDPVIDWLRGVKGEVKNSKIREAGGPTVTTLANWWSGKTRRPQFATVAATAKALGKNSIPLNLEKKK